MKLRASLVAILFIAAAAVAGPITGPAEFKRDTIAEFKVSPKGSVSVKIPDTLSVVKTADKWYIAGVPGEYKLSGLDFWVDYDKKVQGIEDFDLVFRILPSDATPTPKPGPTPSTRTNPFTDDTPRVMILTDPLSDTGLSATQVGIIYGNDARDAMKTLAGDNVRVWTKTTDAPSPWKEAMTKATSYPWIMGGKGSQGFSQAIPEKMTLVELKSLLEMKGPPSIPAVASNIIWQGGGQTIYTAPACTPIYTRINGKLVQTGQSCPPALSP